MNVGSIENRGIETFFFLKSKFIKILSHNFMIHWFKYFDQKLYSFYASNVSIPSD